MTYYLYVMDSESGDSGFKSTDIQKLVSMVERLTNWSINDYPTNYDEEWFVDLDTPIEKKEIN